MLFHPFSDLIGICLGVIKARLKTSGKKSFDMDPGWPGIEQDLKNVATIPIQTRRAWLKAKRDTGKFDNCFPTGNAKPRCSVSQVKKKNESFRFFQRGTCREPQDYCFFPSRRDMSPCFLSMLSLRGKILCQVKQFGGSKPRYPTGLCLRMQASLSHWVVFTEGLP